MVLQMTSSTCGPLASFTMPETLIVENYQSFHPWQTIHCHTRPQAHWTLNKPHDDTPLIGSICQGPYVDPPVRRGSRRSPGAFPSHGVHRHVGGCCLGGRSPLCSRGTGITDPGIVAAADSQSILMRQSSKKTLFLGCAPRKEHPIGL